MANEERNENDLYIKEKRRYNKFFVTSSAKMSNDKITETTISSSHYEAMSQSFAKGEHLQDDGFRDINGGILYMLQEMQNDIDDIHNEVSASAFQSSFFPFVSAHSASFGLMSSSLIPHKDDKYDLGKSGNEWKDLYIDGTAYIDSLEMGPTVSKILDEDNMASDSDAALATQQSIKAYVDANSGGTIDSSLSNSSNNAVRNSAVHLGLSTKLNLSGGTMTGLIQPIVATVKSAPNKNTIDARATNVFQVNSKQAITIDMATAAHAGQEMTIVNLGQGAVTITHQGKPIQTSFFIAGGKNLSITTGQAYKFVYTTVNQWLLIQ